MQENLFYGGEIPAKEKKKKRTEDEKTSGYFWVTTRLLRESGPWYATAVHQPQDVRDIMRDHLDLENADREHLVAIYLDRKGNILAINVVSIGSLSSSIVHPREVFKTALLTSASSIIVCHNHPSGDPTQSREDVDVTRRLVEAGKIMGIEVVDHVIIGMDSYVSLKEKNLL